MRLTASLRAVLVAAAMVLVPGVAGATPAAVGIYFDTSATITSLVCLFCESRNQPFTAYVIATDAGQQVGGATYKLSSDPWIQLTAASYPPGTQTGDPVTTGVVVEFSDCFDGTGAAVVLISTLTFQSTGALWPGASADISIEAHPAAGAVLLSDCAGNSRAVVGGGAFAVIPLPAEELTWGAIKSLYGQ